MGELRNAQKYSVLVPEGKRSLGNHMCGLENDTKTDFRESGCGYVHWIHLAQNGIQWRSLRITLMKFRVQ
jgi:hypothetical protein